MKLIATRDGFLPEAKFAQWLRENKDAPKLRATLHTFDGWKRPARFVLVDAQVGKTRREVMADIKTGTLFDPTSGNALNTAQVWFKRK